jgi:RNA polymerase sigma-70 factor (ECF subfamily)
MQAPSSTAKATDPDLSDARAGSRDALDRVLRRYRPHIDRMCRRMCTSTATDQLDDVIQETYLAIVRNIGNFRGEASFLTWAYTIARTSRGRQLRRDRLAARRAELLASISDSLPTGRGDERSPDDAIADRELGHAISELLSALSDTDRSVLLMRDLEGWTAHEVASRTGLSVPAVKTRLHRARVNVRSKIGHRIGSALAA